MLFRSQLWDKSEFRTAKKSITFKDFYSENLFQEVEDFIGKKQSSYRIVSLALDPSIALFNGFYCLDGYLPDYPLKHKHSFKRVIDPELNQKPSLASYFNDWGSRCYFYHHDIGHNYLNNDGLAISRLDANISALKELGGDYIFSGVKIETLPENVTFLKAFDTSTAYWKLYLYKISG